MIRYEMWHNLIIIAIPRKLVLRPLHMMLCEGVLFMKKRYILLLAAILLCLSFTACGPTREPEDTDFAYSLPPSPAENGQQETKVVEIANFEITSGIRNSYEYEFSEFDLGDRSYTTLAGRKMPYKLRGIMAVPVGDGPFPVILITHGSHENLDETKRFDTGYDYLVKALAQNGYAAISMDMLMPYIWKYGDVDDMEKSIAVADEHIKSILAASGGEALYPIDLTNRADMDKIALIGHSRGGETLFQIAEDQREKGVNIETLLSIAPSWDISREFPDVSATVIVPQYDGDVTRLDGIALYDYLLNNTNGDYSVTFLMGANHNFFNRNIERDDSTSHEVEDGHPALSREEQEEFLVNYAVDFFDASFGIEDRFYQISQPQPSKMYGLDISRSIHLNHAIGLVDTVTADNFSGNMAAVKHVVDSWFFKEDDILIDTVTIGLIDKDLNQINLNRDLISIEWDSMDSTVKIIPIKSDFSGKSALSIHIVPDSASALNRTDEALQFTIILRDTDGNTAAVVTAADQNILSCYPGKLGKTQLTDSIVEYWQPATPLGTLNIPLALFKGVNFTAIESMELLFDRTGSGAIFIDAIEVQ